eukprot:NODE_639_length_2872_cov_13.393443.p1 GENE.NODE_639_length_2872_cov_13.393443~~NODE_639_length_2872_cov_13.393443.p1  ORF type:complete len:557 (-),score=100.47 NODE_639_length_2872_cov_13.393443:615-2285(-)
MSARSARQVPPVLASSRDGTQWAGNATVPGIAWKPEPAPRPRPRVDNDVDSDGFSPSDYNPDLERSTPAAPPPVNGQTPRIATIGSADMPCEVAQLKARGSSGRFVAPLALRASDLELDALWMDVPHTPPAPAKPTMPRLMVVPPAAVVQGNGGLLGGAGLVMTPPAQCSRNSFGGRPVASPLLTAGDGDDGATCPMNRTMPSGSMGASLNSFAAPSDSRFTWRNANAAQTFSAALRGSVVVRPPTGDRPLGGDGSSTTACGGSVAAGWGMPWRGDGSAGGTTPWRAMGTSAIAIAAAPPATRCAPYISAPRGSAAALAPTASAMQLPRASSGAMSTLRHCATAAWLPPGQQLWPSQAMGTALNTPPYPAGLPSPVPPEPLPLRRAAEQKGVEAPPASLKGAERVAAADAAPPHKAAACGANSRSTAAARGDADAQCQGCPLVPPLPLRTRADQAPNGWELPSVALTHAETASGGSSGPTLPTPSGSCYSSADSFDGDQTPPGSSRLATPPASHRLLLSSQVSEELRDVSDDVAMSLPQHSVFIPLCEPFSKDTTI